MVANHWEERPKQPQRGTTRLVPMRRKYHQVVIYTCYKSCKIRLGTECGLCYQILIDLIFPFHALRHGHFNMSKKALNGYFRLFFEEKLLQRPHLISGFIYISMTFYGDFQNFYLIR